MTNIGNSAKLSLPDWGDEAPKEIKKLHQLSPYIGKLKPHIASKIISDHTKKGDLIVDPFSGSGTIPLAAMYLHRDTFASDISSYSNVLTKGKLFSPTNLNEALETFDQLHHEVLQLPNPDLRKVPAWVRSFFHHRTLKETLKWAQVVNKPGNEFFMACLLGILHHQRPGFLSYPSSHLVPYLRNKKYPKHEFPELYEYREVTSRLKKKIIRALQTPPPPRNVKKTFLQQDICEVNFPSSIDAIITSPPYMNALDYIRDNRLRLWLLGDISNLNKIKEPTNSIKCFEKAMKSLVEKANNSLRIGGKLILIMGEIKRKNTNFLDYIESFVNISGNYELLEIINDKIPGIRRSRRNCRAIKNEMIFIYQKRQNHD